MMIVGDEYHVISIDCAERRQAISHDGKEGNQDVVNNVDVVFLPPICRTDPSYSLG